MCSIWFILVVAVAIIINLTITTTVVICYAVAADAISNKTLNDTAHLCSRQETYTELVRVPVRQEVKVRSASWCLEIPPRCSNYKTEMREVIKLQNQTKTKTIEFCCEGYAEIPSQNETVCKPACQGGCGRGICSAPNQCTCDVGYVGRHCSHRCQHGRWGTECKGICQCRNDAYCDHKTGKCRCTEGWMGEHCDKRCPDGSYGSMCKGACECSSKKCDAISGECIPEEDGEFEEATANSTSIASDSHQPSMSLNDTSHLIETLNSTIANLTENIDKLSKNLNRTAIAAAAAAAADPVTILVPHTIMEVTTMKALQEVIVIKPHDGAETAIVMPDRTSIVDGKNSAIVHKTTSPEIIHVIGNWQQHLHKIQHSNDTVGSDVMRATFDRADGVNAVLLIIAIFALAILACSIGFVVLYRRYLKRLQNRSFEGKNDVTEIKENSKVLAKPLPDLPAFTQNITQNNCAPEFYDRPSNNSVVGSITPQQSTYSSSSEYTSVSQSHPKSLTTSNRGSIENFYDEIKYSTKAQSTNV